MERMDRSRTTPARSKSSSDKWSGAACSPKQYSRRLPRLSLVEEVVRESGRRSWSDDAGSVPTD